MLVLAGEIHHLRHFGLRYLIRKDAAHANTAAMDVQHDASRFLTVFVEEPLENVHDEFHRRVVVVEHQNFVHRGLLRLRLRLDDDARIGTLGAVSFFDVAHAEPVDQTSLLWIKTQTDTP